MRALMLSKMKEVDVLPQGQDFIAVWRTAKGIFSEAFNYNAEEDQFYVYDSMADAFIPECDSGYTWQFFKAFTRDEMKFFVEGK